MVFLDSGTGLKQGNQNAEFFSQNLKNLSKQKASFLKKNYGIFGEWNRPNFMTYK